MTEQSYLQIEVATAGGNVFAAEYDRLALPRREPCGQALDAAEPFLIRVRRNNTDRRWRLRLGVEVIGDLGDGQETLETKLAAWLHDEFGETAIVVETEFADAQGRFERLFTLEVRIIPRPPVERDYKVMIEDATRVHVALAYDVLGRAYRRMSYSPQAVRQLEPAAHLDELEDIYRKLDAAVASIAKQPCTTLDRVVVASHYRGGDRVDATLIASLARDTHTKVNRHGELLRVGKILSRRSRLTEDLPEHRHIAEAARRLAQRCLALARHCDTSADLVRQEELYWGDRPGETDSVYLRRDLPRVEALADCSAKAVSLAGRFQQLLSRYAFLSRSGPPRSVFGPTPVFLGRPAYREVYRILLAAMDPLGLLVDSGALRISYRNLATLYEYWCFLRTIEHLRQRLGSPLSKTSFELIDDIYRPELKPGQRFVFKPRDDLTVTARYCPQFHPLMKARRLRKPFGAAFTGKPLRPDILIEVRREGRPPRMLVMDAKATELFTPRRFREMSDYARQIVDPDTGYQPVKHVFLLHRSRDTGWVTNVPKYLSGRRVDPNISVLGAVPCVPEYVNGPQDMLGRVIDRFLQTVAGF